jgi:hypothetical protein
MTPDRGEDRDALSDALIDLERLTARIARREGVTIALPTEGAYSVALTEIHLRIAKACGLEDD